jgi:hypothetical protein
MNIFFKKKKYIWDLKKVQIRKNTFKMNKGLIIAYFNICKI